MNGKSWRTRIWRSAVVMIALAPSLALAQFSESYAFLKAVRERDGDKVTSMIDRPGSVLINSHDSRTGETALMISTARRDTDWIAFLLDKGANPNLTDNNGETALLVSVQLRYLEGAQQLLAKGAQIDKVSSNGETPLIRAVHLRDVQMVHFLIAHGANPDKRDLTGNSARDYARKDSRGTLLLDALDDAKPSKAPSAAVQGPGF